MNLLLISEMNMSLTEPDFGPALRRHLEEKKHPGVYASSLTAWNLLALGMARLGSNILPEVEFEANGKPLFRNHPLHFSLSHSGNLAAALLSDAPCAVDVERIRPETAQRLRMHCLSPAELRAGCDFFECWTRKECLGKLHGSGISAHPAQTDSLNSEYAGFFHTQKIQDAAGREYALTALCMNPKNITIQKIEPEALL